jgi:purine-binding chemotaxis protein CheW
LWKNKKIYPQNIGDINTKRSIEMKADQLADKKAVLKARARELAKEQEKDIDEKKFLEIIRFRMASETYGVESAFVRDVYPLRDFTPLPGAPPFVLGIVNVRGQILSIVDLKKFFNLPERGLGDLNKVIILRDDRMEFGILADAILGVGPVPLDEIRALPITVSEIGAEYLRGVTSDGVIILNAVRILGDERIIVQD